MFILWKAVIKPPQGKINYKYLKKKKMEMQFDLLCHFCTKAQRSMGSFSLEWTLMWHFDGITHKNPSVAFREK